MFTQMLVAERKRDEQKTEEAKLSQSSALEAAAMGIWDYDLLKNSMCRSPMYDEIFGHKEFLTEWNLDIFASHVISEDVAQALEAFQLGIEKGIFRMQCRISRSNDKAIRWISMRGKVFKNENGIAERMMGTVADITDIRDKVEQQRVVAAVKEREEFMATVTHDMKNPLIGADRLLELFVTGKLGALTGEQCEALQCLKVSNFALLKLIGNLLEVYRFEKDVNILSTADTDLVTLITSCVSRTIPFADLRSIKIVAHLPKNMIALVDEGRLERVVQNLLDNALKFTPDDSTIQVRLLDVRGESIIEIEDNGPGIAPAEQTLLFKRFSQASAGKRFAAGSGLGLYLCKQIVEAHSGTIECESQPNIATIFRICLPTGYKTCTINKTIYSDLCVLS